MNSVQLADLLQGLAPGSLYYFDTLPSTNSTAQELAAQGAGHLSLVVADEQTAGRGRRGRQWFTPAGAALAFSLVWKPGEALPDLARLNVLGSLAVCEALRVLYGLDAQIKWPNDVLLEGRKTAGVLAEAGWEGEAVQVVVLGIGLNVTPQAIPAPGDQDFPATSVETALGRPVDRWELLKAILGRLAAWQNRLQSAEFYNAWQGRVAFRGNWVRVQDGGVEFIARLEGVNEDGTLQLLTQQGQKVRLASGEGSLRPLQA